MTFNLKLKGDSRKSIAGFSTRPAPICAMVFIEGNTSETGSFAGEAFADGKEIGTVETALASANDVVQKMQLAE